MGAIWVQLGAVRPEDPEIPAPERRHPRVWRGRVPRGRAAGQVTDLEAADIEA